MWSCTIGCAHELYCLQRVLPRGIPELGIIIDIHCWSIKRICLKEELGVE